MFAVNVSVFSILDLQSSVLEARRLTNIESKRTRLLFSSTRPDLNLEVIL
jgi:hypothetical protein